jgi:hypothetical protein
MIEYLLNLDWSNIMAWVMLFAILWIIVAVFILCFIKVLEKLSQ